MFLLNRTVYLQAKAKEQTHRVLLQIEDRKPLRVLVSIRLILFQFIFIVGLTSRPYWLKYCAQYSPYKLMVDIYF